MLHRFALICSTVLLLAVDTIAGATPHVGRSQAAEADHMELVIFARFHAIAGKEDAIAAELRDAVERVRKEPGCLSIEAYHSVPDPRLFWIHSRWVDEAAFNQHVDLPATNQFVDRVQRLTIIPSTCHERIFFVRVAP